MVAHRDAVVGQQLVAIGVQEHGDSIWDPRACCPGPVVDSQILVGVIPELVLETLVVCPVPKRGGIGKADAHDLNTERLKSVVIVAEPATL